jgi:hypothetical protein
VLIRHLHIKRRSIPAAALLIAVLLGSVTTAPVAAANPAYGIQRTKTRTIRGVYSLEVSSQTYLAKEWLVYAAQAPELPGQSGARTRLLPAGEPYVERSNLRRALLWTRIPVQTEAQQHGFAAQIEWTATLYDRRLVTRGPGVRYEPAPPLSDVERGAALAETTTLDYSAREFQDWLTKNDLRRGRKESEIDFGRRVFLKVTRSLRYQFAESMDRVASHVCVNIGTDSGGMSALFVAALRANQIPARMLVGRWAKSSEPDATFYFVPYHQQHVKAEFYAQGVGWVPVDPGSAVLHDKTPAGVDYFGKDPGDFLTVHVDPDVKVESVRSGVRDMTFLWSYHYYVYGDGTLEPTTVKRNWVVETIR